MLPIERNASGSELNLQRILVNALQKTSTQLLMDLHRRANDRISLGIPLRLALPELPRTSPQNLIVVIWLLHRICAHLRHLRLTVKILRSPNRTREPQMTQICADGLCPHSMNCGESMCVHLRAFEPQGTSGWMKCACTHCPK